MRTPVGRLRRILVSEIMVAPEIMERARALDKVLVRMNTMDEERSKSNL